ncbi:alpha/beta hydrolase [uncultured Cocleimonas sp.]|uniref:PHA/PHB synthase family protein n=1 Tax=uncultured Cocleimonas sp. TaxID=1051587 RepID=UPI002616C7E8|nr:class I poly(R)-hydroxyalkanoic acid synthase [uncultured Cocleimonas sp.]
MDNNNLDKVTQNFLTAMTTETQKLMEMFGGKVSSGDDDWGKLNETWAQMFKLPQTPDEVMKTISDYQKNQLEFWSGLMGISTEEDTKPARGDRRFQSEEWSKNPVFNYIKESYLMTSQMIQKTAQNANLDPQKQKKLEFYTQQYIDALSPSNFFATNPEAIQNAIDTKGQSLMDGMQNLKKDMDKGRISMTDETAFTLGENIATTEGSVIFQNELMQLIQYSPATDTVAERPILIIPPCINKFYILDLQPHNSFVKYAVDQGNTVFLISWVNATPEQRHLSWDNYVESGVLKALEVVKAVSSSKRVNCVSWCVGGTITASALAVLAARKDNTVSSATFLTTLTDFEDPGEIEVFLDDPDTVLGDVEAAGVLDGKNLATVFNMLRSNDLIWSNVVNSYLKGKSPAPFDILYWNSDPTSLPADMYTYYLTNMYQQNNLIKPDCLTICGEKINLGKITAPCYFLSTIDDHIAPWKSTFAATEIIPNVEFVLGGSGHVAGVINPASKNRRNHWIKGETGKGTDHWLETAKNVQGTWWNHWAPWVKKRAGKQVAAPKAVGNKDYPILEPAPGSFVKTRIN